VRLVWTGWTAYVHRAAGYQSVLVLHLVYFGIFGPTALIARLGGAALLDRDLRPRPSYWLVRPPAPKTVTQLKRQF